MDGKMGEEIGEEGEGNRFRFVLGGNSLSSHGTSMLKLGFPLLISCIFRESVFEVRRSTQYNLLSFFSFFLSPLLPTYLIIVWSPCGSLTAAREGFYPSF